MAVQMLTVSDLKKMQSVNPETVDRSALKDIREVHINTELPKKERILDFIRPLLLPPRRLRGKSWLC